MGPASPSLPGGGHGATRDSSRNSSQGPGGVAGACGSSLSLLARHRHRRAPGEAGEAGEAGSRASFTPAGRASAHARPRRLCRARARVALWPLLRPSCCPSPGKAVLSGRRDGVAVSPFRPPTHPLPVRGAQPTADGVRLVPRGWRTERRRRGPRPRRCGGSGGGCRRPPAASCACAWRRSSCRSWGTGSAPSAAAQVSRGARGAGRGRGVARGLRAGGAAHTGCRGPSRAATPENAHASPFRERC